MSKRQREPDDPRVHSGDSLTEKDALILKAASQFADVSKEQQGIQTKLEADWASDASGDDQEHSPPHTLSTTIISPGFKNEKSSIFVEAMLEKGADVNAKDAQDWTPLHVAAYYGQEDVCEVLAKVQGIDLDAQNTHGDTALHMAAKWPHGEHQSFQ
jgi:ankyrin repeat protein